MYDIKVSVFRKDSRGKFVDCSSGGLYIKIHENRRNYELAERLGR